jgi:hypothetical protein
MRHSFLFPEEKARSGTFGQKAVMMLIVFPFGPGGLFRAAQVANLMPSPTLSCHCARRFW